jgi:hypothetical protein
MNARGPTSMSTAAAEKRNARFAFVAPSAVCSAKSTESAAPAADSNLCAMGLDIEQERGR